LATEAKSQGSSPTNRARRAHGKKKSIFASFFIKDLDEVDPNDPIAARPPEKIVLNTGIKLEIGFNAEFCEKDGTFRVHPEASGGQ